MNTVNAILEKAMWRKTSSFRARLGCEPRCQCESTVRPQPSGHFPNSFTSVADITQNSTLFAPPNRLSQPCKRHHLQASHDITHVTAKLVFKCAGVATVEKGLKNSQKHSKSISADALKMDAGRQGKTTIDKIGEEHPSSFVLQG